MKFEISENKLEKVIFQYLDNKLVVEETKKKYYFFEKGDNEYSLIDVIKLYDYKVCNIDIKLIRELMSFFSINKNKSEDVIRNYVQKTLNIEVTSTWIEY